MQNDSRTKPVIAMYTAEYSVNGFKSLHLKESVLADGPLSLPGLNAGVSRGGTDEKLKGVFFGGCWRGGSLDRLVPVGAGGLPSQRDVQNSRRGKPRI